MAENISEPLKVSQRKRQNALEKATIRLKLTSQQKEWKPRGSGRTSLKY
jgi:hypothetical protein